MPRISFEILNEIKENIKNIEVEYYRYIEENKNNSLDKDGNINIPINEFIEKKIRNDIIDFSTDKEINSNDTKTFNFLELGSKNSENKKRFINVMSGLIFLKQKEKENDDLQYSMLQNDPHYDLIKPQKEIDDEKYYFDKKEEILDLFQLDDLQLNAVIDYINDINLYRDVAYINPSGKYTDKETAYKKISNNNLFNIIDDTTANLDKLKYHYQKRFIETAKKYGFDEETILIDDNLDKLKIINKANSEKLETLEIGSNEYLHLLKSINDNKTLIQNYEKRLKSLDITFNKNVIKNIINKMLIEEYNDYSTTLDKDYFNKQNEACINAVKDLFNEGMAKNILDSKEEYHTNFSYSTLENILLENINLISGDELKELNELKFDKDIIDYTNERIDKLKSIDYFNIFKGIQEDLFNPKGVGFNEVNKSDQVEIIESKLAKEIERIEKDDQFTTIEKYEQINDLLDDAIEKKEKMATNKNAKLTIVTNPLNYKNVTSYSKELRRFKKILDNKPWYIRWFSSEYKKQKDIYNKAVDFIANRGVDKNALNKYIKDKNENTILLDMVYAKSKEGIEKYNVKNAGKINAVISSNENVKRVEASKREKESLEAQKVLDEKINDRVYTEEELKDFEEQDKKEEEFLKNYKYKEEIVFGKKDDVIPFVVEEFEELEGDFKESNLSNLALNKDFKDVDELEKEEFNSLFK